MKKYYFEYICPMCGSGVCDGEKPLPIEPISFWCQDCPFEGTTEDCELHEWENDKEETPT